MYVHAGPDSRLTTLNKRDPRSLLLESVACEFQRATVLGYGTDNLIRSSAGECCLNLECDRNLRTHLSGQMCDHLVRDAARVAADARGIELDRAVESAGWWGCHRRASSPGIGGAGRRSPRPSGSAPPSGLTARCAI